LLLFIRAKILKRLNAYPESAASKTLANRRRVDLQRLQFNVAPRARTGLFVGYCLRIHGSFAAIPAEFTADEHHAKTRRTSNSLETSLAKLALRAVARDSRSAVWAIQSFSLHKFLSDAD
jgi:hypothetical protein